MHKLLSHVSFILSTENLQAQQMYKNHKRAREVVLVVLETLSKLLFRNPGLENKFNELSGRTYSAFVSVLRGAMSAMTCLKEPDSDTGVTCPAGHQQLWSLVVGKTSDEDIYHAVCQVARNCIGESNLQPVMEYERNTRWQA